VGTGCFPKVGVDSKLLQWTLAGPVDGIYSNLRGLGRSTDIVTTASQRSQLVRPDTDTETHHSSRLCLEAGPASGFGAPLLFQSCSDTKCSGLLGTSSHLEPQL
jgi:hypothetical protein